MSVRFFPNPYVDATSNQPLSFPPGQAVQKCIECLQSCFASVSTNPRNFDGGLYTGYLGIAWAALHVLRLEQLPPGSRESITGNANQFIQAALSYVAERTKVHQSNKEDSLSMLLGIPGVWLTASMFYHRFGDLTKRDQYLHAYKNLASQFLPEILFQQGSDEFFIGRAGYLAGLVALRSYTGEHILPDETVYSICDAIVQSGLRYTRSHRSSCPLMYAYYGTEYLGAGHGLAGILFALMLFPSYFKANPTAEQLVRQSLLFMIGVTPAATGNLPAAMDEVDSSRRRRPDSDVLVHWCHGATGAILAYARAYILWKDERYLTECYRCADVVWQRGLLKKGPGICHGVAGSGYVFLLMYRLTGRPLYLHRASNFAYFMQTDVFRQARRPDCPYSLFEGLAGTACFYADFANPCSAAFPFMDPFWDAECQLTNAPSSG
ncbi:uncharacterized protein DEA37_0007844 [Paragonimus westermani]|uniref:LanC-like protein 3 n=1 Tax=Paragonimus westermani TaxID=34504 RepID=A0A5J4P0A2_9TREM|nr:uncharacterized protein DEA37_0007844 [Paragonimus westermani]